jgi:hypothetical protein
MVTIGKTQEDVQAPLHAAVDPHPPPATSPAATGPRKGPSNGEVVAGAAAAGAIAGCCLFGPILGIVGAAGAAYAASKDSGVAGDAARQLGKGAVAATASAKDLDRKHQISAKAAQFFQATAVKAQQLGEEWKVKERVEATARRAQEFEKEHQLTSRAANGLADGLAAATRAINKLPPGWSAKVDETTGRQYYVNEHTGGSQWEFPTGPAALPAASTESSTPAPPPSSSPIHHPPSKPVPLRVD